MTARKAQSSFKSQFALLAHVYKVEIIELAALAGRWLIYVVDDLYRLLWSIATYSVSHHHHQRRHR
jgi:hypothetical protein